jgi:hypothetical protein
MFAIGPWRTFALEVKAIHFWPMRTFGKGDEPDSSESGG